uniref:Uncharacterized protein n=1 Tax=Strongyloides papillosus TaxID=174720 RepID=A0A0N5B3U6_STREA
MNFGEKRKFADKKPFVGEKVKQNEYEGQEFNKDGELRLDEEQIFDEDNEREWDEEQELNENSENEGNGIKN